MVTKARITLFNLEQEGKINEPLYRGYIDTGKKKMSVTLWRKDNEKVTGGYLLEGQITEDKRE